jgi:hypothetical protein
MDRAVVVLPPELELLPPAPLDELVAALPELLDDVELAPPPSPCLKSSNPQRSAHPAAPAHARATNANRGALTSWSLSDRTTRRSTGLDHRFFFAPITPHSHALIAFDGSSIHERA